MEQFATAVGVAIAFGLIFAFGDWIFGRLSSELGERLHTGWRWLALPITAFLSFAAFMALRPLILDQPRTPLWFILGLTAVALLISGASAIGWALVQLGRGLVAFMRGRW